MLLSSLRLCLAASFTTRAKILLPVLLAGPVALRLAADPLYEAFREPEPTARPFVRWWWNGGRINAAEIERQLDVMRAAGIGGIEINTIGMPEGADPASLAAHPAVEWLSPEWNALVRHTAVAARKRGMTADLLVGSGWPFGGRFLAPSEQTQRVKLTKRTLTGPRPLSLSRAELLEFRPEPAAPDSPPPSKRELLFLRLVPAGAFQREFNPGRELSGEFGADGHLEIQIPAGEHLLYTGVREFGFTHVKLGAPGADGPVVNHFDAAAVRRYLDHMAAGLAPALGGDLGGKLRAVFVDSLELDHANWTEDLAAEFRRRRHYELWPYLPFVIEPDEPSDLSGFRDTVRRARYDFHRTLVELFDERFLATYRAWATHHGVQPRIQAYGREAHPLHGSMQAVLPEGETWIWVDPAHPTRLRVESTVINKYVASAANLTGQRLRSFEAMTNAVPVFRETLQDFKRGFDATAVAGLNHPIMHGFNYTPLDAGFPGWVRFGSYLNERTPWWPHFTRFSDYAGRLGAVLRRSEARARIAVLAPRAGEWARHGLLYQPFPEVSDPWYQFKLIDALQQAGYNADYISERIVVEGDKASGRLRFGPCAYEVLILQEVRAMEPDTAAALAEFVSGGGCLVVIGAWPDQAPGLHDADLANAHVRRAIAPLRAAVSPRLHQIPPPVPDPEAATGSDEALLLDFATGLLARTGLDPDVRFTESAPEVSQVSHWDGPRAIHFLVNRDPRGPRLVEASFPAASGRPYRWDPHTGDRSPVPLDAAGRIRLELEPAGSALLVFNPDEPAVVAGPPPRPASPLEEKLVLPGPWRLELITAGTDRIVHRELPRLVDLSQQASDPALSHFGGAVWYETEFDTQGSDNAVLDLGEVFDVSEAWLNGEPLGTRWFGWHRYPLGARLQPGRHRLRVKVSTMLANLMRHRKEDAAAQRWAHWAPPIPAGLVGPVRLLDGPDADRP